MRFILVGPAGSGKGTQSSLLSKKYDIPAISTGELLRERSKKEDELGIKISKIISTGDMVADDIMYDILKKRLVEDDCRKGFILDGFPRNMEQAVELDKWLLESQETITGVLVLQISEDIVFKRITGRFECVKCKTSYNTYFNDTKIKGICDNCQATEFVVRADDSNFEVIQRRLDIFREMSESIINYYDKKNLVHFIDGLKTPDNIFQDILSNLKNV